MNLEHQSSDSNQTGPSKISRLFNTVAFFGIFYTAYDIAATIGNIIYTATTPGGVELSANNVSVLSAAGAAAGAIVMDRIFQHHNHLEQSEHTEVQLANEEPRIES